MSRITTVRKALTTLGAGSFLALALALVLPAAIASAANVPCTVPADLYAVSGSTTLGAQTVTVWGYGTANVAATQPGGPTLCVTAGATVTITLHNQLAEATTLLFQGQEGVVPDRTGVAAGGTKVYTFTAGRPGTYLYEAGLLPNGQHQVAMGLYGALIVRPATNPTTQAYDAASTAFNDEAVLVLSEVDPALNNRTVAQGGPAAFDMRKYAPRYFLINGKAYPSTAPIPTTAGQNVLLRYLNAGNQYHSMAFLGGYQSVIALDGSPLNYARRYVAETIGPGQTADAIVTVAPTAAAGSRFAVYDGSLSLHNSNTAGIGGMLTFIQVAGTSGGSGAPVTSGVTLTPSATNGAAAVTLTAAITSPVSAAEYFVDVVGANGTGCAIGGSLTSVSVTIPVSGATAPCADLATLTSGSHAFYVHGANGATWGSVASAVLVLDKAGPTVSGVAVTPNRTNGTADVALHATASDSATGGANVVAAEYSIDGVVQLVPVMTINLVAPTVSLDVTIPAATVNALTEGVHTVAIRSQDARGNWGALATSSLTVDKTGPTTGVVTVVPSPNNGTIPFNSATLAVRLTAPVGDPVSGTVNSTIVAAEAFIDVVGANGAGIVMAASDGSYNTPSETGIANIPLATVGQLTNGSHTIYVHAKDAAGNWGTTATTTLVIDKTAPTFASISLAPNPTYGATTVVLTVNGSADTGVGVAGGEYWINPPTSVTPAAGTGTPFTGLTATIPVPATGTYTVSARIRDAAGNWSTGTNGIRSASLTVVPDAIFSNGFDTGGRPWGWSSASTNSGTRLNVTSSAPLAGARSLVAQGNNTNYVQYNFGTAANPATPTFDARFLFNPNGNTGANQDILVARTTGGTTVFRVRYRWNGGAPQVQIQVGTGTANTAWTGITNGVSNRIEVTWQSGGALQLFVGASAVASQTLTATATSIGQVRLGSVTNGGSALQEKFDGFVAKRTLTPLVGP